MKTPFNFLGIPEVPEKHAQAVVLPVPFEHTTSYGQGTKKGPRAIIEASRQIEFYDEEFGDDLQAFVSIATTKPVTGSLKAIEKEAGKYTEQFCVGLGGEHSVTPALIAPLVKKYPDLSVLQIDAHTDMRDSYEGSKHSHASAMARVKALGVKDIVAVGIRATAKEEQPFLNKKNIFWGDEFKTKDVLKRLSKHVYVTFDVDGLDAAIMPATGTPEPGGLSYKQAVELLRAVAREKNVVAADFVELAPIKNMPAYDFMIAKLVYKLIGFKFAKAKKD